MTSIGFRSAGFATPPLARAPRPVTAVGRVPRARVAVAPPPTSTVRLGRVNPSSALRYLLVWASVLWAVVFSVLVLTYALLAVTGVIGSVSRALALVSSGDTSSGLVPALQPLHVLPMLLLLSLLLAGLFFVSALGMVLVHNATTSLTGGLQVRLRDEVPPVPASAPVPAPVSGPVTRSDGLGWPRPVPRISRSSG